MGVMVVLLVMVLGRRVEDLVVKVRVEGMVVLARRERARRVDCLEVEERRDVGARRRGSREAIVVGFRPLGWR